MLFSNNLFICTTTGYNCDIFQLYMYCSDSQAPVGLQYVAIIVQYLIDRFNVWLAIRIYSQI